MVRSARKYFLNISTLVLILGGEFHCIPHSSQRYLGMTAEERFRRLRTTMPHDTERQRENIFSTLSRGNRPPLGNSGILQTCAHLIARSRDLARGAFHGCHVLRQSPWARSIVSAILTAGMLGWALFGLYDIVERNHSLERAAAREQWMWGQAEAEALRLRLALSEPDTAGGEPTKHANRLFDWLRLLAHDAEEAGNPAQGESRAFLQQSLPVRDAIDPLIATARAGVTAAAKVEIERLLAPIDRGIEQFGARVAHGDHGPAGWRDIGIQQAIPISVAVVCGLILLAMMIEQTRSSASQRRLIEAETKASAAARARFEDAIESISEGFAIYDAEDRLVLCNEAQRAAHPRAPRAFQPGRKYSEIMRELMERGLLGDDRLAAEKMLERLIDFHHSGEGTVERQTVDGGWIRLGKRRTREGGIVTIRADITELKAQQQELAEKTAMLGTILDNIGSGLVAYDQNFKLTAWNDLYLKLNEISPGFVRVGLPMEDIFRHNVSRGIFGPHDHETRLMERIALARSRTPRHEIRERPNGRVIEIVVRPLPTGGFVSLLTDITEQHHAEQKRRQLEIQLNHSQKLESLGTLAGGIAHDLNNTLQPILALTKLALKRLPSGSPEREDMEIMHQAGVRGRDLVKQVLAFSRKEDIARETFDLADVVKGALGMLRATLPSSIELTHDIARIPPIFGNAGQIHQVIVNLVTNACHAIGEKNGDINVTLVQETKGETSEQGWARLSIRDSGCGIGQSTLARIFEPFFTTKKVGEGTGLGLSVVHGIVTNHGGTIDVQSEPGKGSCFTVRLPLAATREIVTETGTKALVPA